MKKKFYNKKISEELLIDKFLTRLNFNKKETFNFQNDAAFIQLKKNNKLIFTNDSIIEGIDFFKNDNPKSIAQKILTINLSDLSAMGSYPYCYMMNLCIPKYINLEWVKIFTNHLFNLQKKYNFFLLGGDLSKSSKLMISSTFIGKTYSNKIISNNKVKLDDDIWVTGNLGQSYAGLKILKSKSNKDIKKKFGNYFITKYYYPKHSSLGPFIVNFSNSAKDISDGFLGDLKKIVKNRFGAKIFLNKIPISIKMKELIEKKFITYKEILNCGDDYQLVFLSNKKNEKRLLKIASLHKIKITKVGKIIKDLGFYNDSNILIKSNKYYDHFLNS